jgi:hypothetical protein
MGAMVSDTWSKEVTYVIISTNENGGARSTTKVLMGILEGKHIIKKTRLLLAQNKGILFRRIHLKSLTLFMVLSPILFC